ncbi:leucyl/phenylalanyl-tRNA--protein transferase [Treponema sp. R80B11-R83G3]
MPRFRPGPDPDFPYLDTAAYFQFPNPNECEDSIIAVGGNLSPGMLLSAYEQGIFPWYSPGDPVIWQSPDPRCVIFPEKLHVSSSMRKILNGNVFKITYDENFDGVIRNCAEKKRPGQNGTWITDDIIEAYAELHQLGFVRSAESWQDGVLVGGCYGLLLGKVFCGESMFANVPNASKTAFLTFAKKLFAEGLAFIDCQIPTRHLISLGGEEMARNDFLTLLKKNLLRRDFTTNHTNMERT